MKQFRKTTGTEQANPHLHFAPKIIKIRSVAFENELFEHVQLTSKKVPKTGMRTLAMYVQCTRPHSSHLTNRCIPAIGTFLKSVADVQTTRSQRLLNGF